MTSESGRLDGIARTARLVADFLKGKEHDAQSASVLLDVKAAAARRQLEALHRHLPGMRTRKGAHGRCYRLSRSLDGAGPPHLGEAIAASFGAALAPLFEGTSYVAGMKDSLRRVVQHVTRAKDFQEVDRKFVFLTCGGEVSLPQKSGILDDIIEAVLSNKRLKIQYRRFGGTVDHLNLKPLSVLVYSHQLYMLAEDATGRRHPYRFSRVEDVAVQSRGFRYPSRSEFDPKQVFGNSFGVFIGEDFPVEHVKLRLTPKWRSYVDSHRWHPSQRCYVDDDGITLTLRVRCCPELEAWILGMGEDIRVIEPTSLCNRIMKRVELMAHMYAQSAARRQR